MKILRVNSNLKKFQSICIVSLLVVITIASNIQTALACSCINEASYLSSKIRSADTIIIARVNELSTFSDKIESVTIEPLAYLYGDGDFEPIFVEYDLRDTNSLSLCQDICNEYFYDFFGQNNLELNKLIVVFIEEDNLLVTGIDDNGAFENKNFNDLLNINNSYELLYYRKFNHTNSTSVVDFSIILINTIIFISIFFIRNKIKN